LGKGSVKINEFKHLPSSYQKVALLVGNEVNGINKRYLNYCDKILEIPLSGKKNH